MDISSVNSTTTAMPQLALVQGRVGAGASQRHSRIRRTRNWDAAMSSSWSGTAICSQHMQGCIAMVVFESHHMLLMTMLQPADPWHTWHAGDNDCGLTSTSSSTTRYSCHVPSILHMLSFSLRNTPTRMLRQCCAADRIVQTKDAT
jgi:hypothetical protein